MGGNIWLIKWQYKKYRNSITSKHTLKIGKTLEYTFFQREYADVPQTHEKILSITNCCCCSVVCDSLRPMDCNTPVSSVLHCHPEFAQVHIHQGVMLSNYLILFCSLFLPPSIFPSFRVFSNESTLTIKWPKYWSFSFKISPFRVDFL